MARTTGTFASWPSPSMARPAESVTLLTTTQSWWLLAAGIAAFVPLIPQVPVWLAAVTAAAFCWRAALAWWHQPLPVRWVLIIVSLAGTAGILAQYRTLFGQKAGVALLLIFMALKQLEARAPRDGLAVVLLAYFLTLAQFFEDQSIPVALMMTGTLIITTAALAHLTDAQGQVRQQLRLSGLMLVQALPFMLILFVLFPRISGPLWGLPTDAYSSLTGLSDSMSPGTINNLIQSDSIAFRVKFSGPVPEKKHMYWRGPVLTRLEDRTWRPGLPRMANERPYTPQDNSPSFRYALTLEAHNKPWLFALELPDTLPPDAFGTGDFQIHAKKPVRERLRYELQSHTTNSFVPPDAVMLRELLRLPAAANPRTTALGNTLRNDHPRDLHRLQRAIDFMRGQQLLYTLQPPLMGNHVADEFLFDHKRGFCEHFASSFVILMRAAGIPARVVTGYQGGEHNPVDDTWVIRQSDAHAWAEVWIDTRGWVRVDPTAVSNPTRIEENLAAALPAGDPLPFLSGAGLDWLRELRYQWWAASNAWNQWVLGYDPQRQKDFLSRLGMAAPDWQKMTAVLAVLCGSVLLALTGWMLYRRPRLDPAAHAWQRFSRKLARRQLPRQAWEGPADYARRCAAALPEHAAEITAISELYRGLRYGQSPSSQLDELRRRVARFNA